MTLRVWEKVILNCNDKIFFLLYVCHYLLCNWVFLTLVMSSHIRWRYSHWPTSILCIVGSGVQRSGDARGDCLIGCPLPNSSIQQWRMVVILIRFTMFVTSQYDVIFTFANERFGEVCWHNVHIQGRRSSGREAVLPPRRAFCGLIPPMKAPKLPNGIMKSVETPL